MTATQRSGFHQFGPVQPLALPAGAERKAGATICDQALQGVLSRPDMYLLLDMCGLLPEPDEPLPLPPGAGQWASLFLAARAQSPGDAVLLLAMCGLLPERDLTDGRSV